MNWRTFIDYVNWKGNGVIVRPDYKGKGSLYAALRKIKKSREER